VLSVNFCRILCACDLQALYAHAVVAQLYEAKRSVEELKAALEEEYSNQLQLKQAEVSRHFDMQLNLT